MASSVEDQKMQLVMEKYGLDKETAENMVRGVQVERNLMHPIDAIEFLLKQT